MERKKQWQQFKSRNQFIGLLLLVVVGGLISTTILMQYGDTLFFSVTQMIVSFSVFVFIFLSRRDPSTKWAWILIVFAIPIVGVALFFLFGRSKRHIVAFKRKIEQNALFDDQYEAFIPVQFKEANPYLQRQYQFLQTIGTRPMYQHTDVQVEIGQQFFDDVRTAVLRAVHHVHLAFYIVREDDVTRPLFEALEAKAREGVEVRFLVDGGGSFNTLSDECIRRFIDAGIKFAFFGEPQSLILDATINWRNHRKIVVIDGTIGFIGGFNLGREYVFGNERTQNWRDTNLRLEGEAVRSLQTVFLGDWYFSTHENFMEQNMLDYAPQYAMLCTEQYVQIITDGPDTQRKPLKNSLYKLIASATQRVWLTTPYLILPDEILYALKAAALSGVDVRISIPGNPDKKMVYLCTQSHIQELLDAGVEIYMLDNTFQHSKVWVFDDHFAACGTANLDYRSLVINFEAMALVSGQKIVGELAAVVEEDFKNSKKIERRYWRERSVVQKLSESFIRLFSPIF
ncbi:MAG: cardiolipin synthase [Culicoidibacterales bacterium]